MYVADEMITKETESFIKTFFIEVCGQPMTLDSEYNQTHT